jgi:DNA repair and recombination RAD54-like protein
VLLPSAGDDRTLALCETSRDDVIVGLQQFLSPAAPFHVLIISYETFRLHAARFTQPDACDLLICDEVRRLLLLLLWWW